MNIVIGLDDFCLEYNVLPVLKKVKELCPNFKCTLFTIPKLTPLELQKEAVDTGYIELAMHGSIHTKYEFAHIKYKYAKQFILENESPYLVKGFKAPNWKISEDTLYVLKDLGYWVALHDRTFRPNILDNLKVFYYNALLSSKFNFDNDLLLQGHCNNYEGCPDNLEKHLNKILSLPKDGNYKFVSEYLQ